MTCVLPPIDTGRIYLYQNSRKLLLKTEGNHGGPPWLTGVILSNTKSKLEQLERLRSEDTPAVFMITHIVESYWIKSKEDKVKGKYLKNLPNVIFKILKQTLHVTYLL